MLSTKIWLEANTERSESNPGRSLGITIIHGELSGRQYPTICSLAFVSLAMFKIYHG